MPMPTGATVRRRAGMRAVDVSKAAATARSVGGPAFIRTTITWHWPPAPACLLPGSACTHKCTSPSHALHASQRTAPLPGTCTLQCTRAAGRGAQLGRRPRHARVVARASSSGPDPPSGSGDVPPPEPEPASASPAPPADEQASPATDAAAAAEGAVSEAGDGAGDGDGEAPWSPQRIRAMVDEKEARDDSALGDAWAELLQVRMMGADGAEARHIYVNAKPWGVAATARVAWNGAQGARGGLPQLWGGGGKSCCRCVRETPALLQGGVPGCGCGCGCGSGGMGRASRGWRGNPGCWEGPRRCPRTGGWR